MKRIFHHTILVFILTIGVISCKKKEAPLPAQETSVSFEYNVINTFCGKNCAACGFSEEKCLALVKGNLQQLCQGPQSTNCYTLWLSLSQTCKNLCRKAKPENKRPR